MQSNKLKNTIFRQKMLPIILALVLVLLMATGFMFANKKVHISFDGTMMDISTLHSKPEEILGQAGVQLGLKDEYHLSTSKVVEGSTIFVDRAVPVNMTYQGKNQAVMTAKKTVGEFVDSLGLKRADLKLIPSEQTKIEPNMNIQVITVTEKDVERQEVEPFTVIHQPDATLEKGVDIVVEEGQDGSKLVTFKVNFSDGVEVSAQPINEKIIEPSKPKIIRVGTRDTIETSRGNMRFSRVEMMEASAYLPTDGSASGITATGVPAHHGIVAVDPNVIPLGSTVYIQGYGVALAADVGGAIIGNKIDVCVEEYGEAIRFGRRSVKVYVLD